MAARNFEESLRRLLRDEGGYTHHPQDPGGPTNFGITIADARRYWKANASAADVRAMPIEVAKGIYRRHYWDALACDHLPDGVDYALFDYGVNSGTGRTSKVLRRLVGLRDNAPRSEAIAAARTVDSSRLVAAICDERLRFLRSLQTWPVFGRGWGARVARVRAAAIAMARGKTLSNDVSGTAVGKGEVPLNTKARTGTAGGAIVLGGAAAQHAANVGADWTTIVIIIITALVIAAAGAAFWRWRQTKRQSAPV